MPAEGDVGYDPDRSVFPGVNWSKETPTVRSNLSTFITRWLSLMKESGLTVFGLAVQTSQPDTG